MKLTDFLKECYVEDSELMQIKECHPKQIISTYLRIPVWRVDYKYKTQRGNEKTATKYMFNYAESEWDGVENEFNNYITEFNNKFQNRQLSNVEILDVTYLGYLIFDFD